MTELIDESTLSALHDSLHGTDADIAFGKLRHIIGQYERLKIGRHCHVASPNGDRCDFCGLDLRDDIHLRVWEKPI